MNGFHLTWTGKKTDFPGQQKVLKELKEAGRSNYRWQCGYSYTTNGANSCISKKGAKAGDLVFLKCKTGIIGMGALLSDLPNIEPHHDPSMADKGKLGHYFPISFSYLGEESLISMEHLKREYPEYNWTPNLSGVPIPKNIVNHLFTHINK